VNSADDLNFSLLPDVDEPVLRQILSQFFVSSFNAILITSANPGYPIVYANPAFCRMTGYSLDELRGQSPKIFQGEKTNSRVLQRMKRNLEAGHAFSGAALNYRKSGECYPVEWNISPIADPQGQVAFYLSVQKDLSNLRQVMSQFKGTNQHFRAFLRDLLESVKHGDTASMAEQVTSAEPQLTRELLDNTRLYNPALRSDTLIDLFEESEFFDVADDLNGVIGDSLEQIFVSAKTYSEQQSLSDHDLGALTIAIQESRQQLDLAEFSANPLSEMLVVADNLQEIANTIFYLEDFLSISSVLSELSTQTRHHVVASLPAFIIETFRALLQDLETWLDTVFVARTAANIHELDASIISSARQLMMFLPRLA